MLFFDAEFSNISEMERIGVVSVLVTNGMSMELLLKGFKKFSNRRNKPIWTRKETTDRALSQNHTTIENTLSGQLL